MKTQASNQGYADQLNRYAKVEFTLHVAYNDEFEPDDFDNSTPYTVTYGFATVRIWNPKTQTWETPDPEKFRVSAHDFATAKAEFWARYRMYCVKRWGYRATANSIYVAPQGNDTYTSFTRHSRANGAQ